MKHKLTILITDDDAHFRAALRKRVTALGFRALEAADGLAALTQCLQCKVDAVILDQEMPASDGRAIARLMRKESTVPIIFLSGHQPEEFRRIVMQLPDVYYLPKPVNNEKLAGLLRQVVTAPMLPGHLEVANEHPVTAGCM